MLLVRFLILFVFELYKHLTTSITEEVKYSSTIHRRFHNFAVADSVPNQSERDLSVSDENDGHVLTHGQFT